MMEKMKGVTVLILGLALAFPAAAGMIATPVQDERARVKAMVERPEVSAELQKMGIPPQEATARVDAMSDEEVLQVAGRLDAAMAGGQTQNERLLILIVLILLLLLLL
ncbi:MAG TPA: PA2779 family protein [Burkholderiales bacterium]|nr:PA2779 family protein [Burkholderiales bacterium]